MLIVNLPTCKKETLIKSLWAHDNRLPLTEMNEKHHRNHSNRFFEKCVENNIKYAHIGIVVISAPTIDGIPKLAKAPRINPHGNDRYCRR
jgi:hypothetical protein